MPASTALQIVQPYAFPRLHQHLGMEQGLGLGWDRFLPMSVDFLISNPNSNSNSNPNAVSVDLLMVLHLFTAGVAHASQ